MTTKRPPVFLTVAALKHEPLLTLGDFLPKIQDALRRKNFAGPIDQDVIAIQRESQTAQVFKSHTIFTPDRTSAFTFNEQGIFSYHTSAYTSRADLFGAFQMGLEILNDLVELKIVNRVGVRMLDLVRPSDTGHTLPDFVNSSILGFQGLECTRGWECGISTLDQRFFDGNAEVIAKFDQLPDGFGIHADLFATVKGHAMADHVVAKVNVLHGILDIDSGTRAATSRAGRPFDLKEVMSELGEHKDRISKIFRNAVTPLALETWGLQ